MITIDDYLSQLTGQCVVEGVAQRTGLSQDDIASMLHTFAAEARFSYGKIAAQLPARGKILEVGAGLCMLSGYLKGQGYEVTSLEPYAACFGRFSEIHSALVAMGLCPLALAIGAEELSPDRHGRFDFIFSVNVLEHIADLEGAMVGMASVLATTGRMWHSCPNYTIPYEPHFSVPLIPFFPAATRWLLPRRIVDSGAWRSLNFVTLFRLRHIAARHGCMTRFKRGLMAESLRRLESDPQFADRHKGWIMRLYRLMKALGLVKLISMFPPAFCTPMEVEIRHSAGSL